MDEHPDDDLPPRPLDREEAAHVRRDLDDLSAFREAFEPDGFKGVSVWCADCDEEHFYGWQMLEQNLRALLESGETPVHEPAFAPRPDEYVDWQYAQGYVDGRADAEVGGPVAPLSATGECPYCGAPMPGDQEALTYCPTCGQHLGPARMAKAMIEAGMKPEAVAELLAAARVRPVRALPGATRGARPQPRGGRGGS